MMHFRCPDWAGPRGRLTYYIHLTVTDWLFVLFISETLSRVSFFIFVFLLKGDFTLIWRRNSFCEAPLWSNWDTPSSGQFVQSPRRLSARLSNPKKVPEAPKRTDENGFDPDSSVTNFCVSVEYESKNVRVALPLFRTSCMLETSLSLLKCIWHFWYFVFYYCYWRFCWFKRIFKRLLNIRLVLFSSASI